jgi:hypothetical protein
VKIDEMSEWLKTAGKIVVGEIGFELVFQLTEIALGRIGVEVVKFFDKAAVGVNSGYTDAVPTPKKKQS